MIDGLESFRSTLVNKRDLAPILMGQRRRLCALKETNAAIEHNYRKT